MADKLALLTGISGFVGSHLAEELLRRGWRVAGFAPHGEDLANIRDVADRIHLYRGDILSQEDIGRALADAGAETVVHLAAASAPAASFSAPELFYRLNVEGTLNLLECARRGPAPERLLFFTSSEIYGPVPRGQIPVREDSPLAPSNPYAASKLACHLLARQYALHFKLPLIEVRPFNMIGPRQSLGFVLPDFACQAAEIMLGKRDPVITVGRLTDQRDFTDVRDAVRAVAALMESDLEGLRGQAFHVCSGRPRAVQSILDELLQASQREIEVRRDPARLRPTRMPVLAGSSDKIERATGWKPSIPLEQSVRDTLAYWVARLR